MCMQTSDPGLLSHLSQCVCRHQIPGYYHISHNVYADIRSRAIITSLTMCMQTSDPGLLSHLSQCVCRHQIPGYYHISHNVYADIRSRAIITSLTMCKQTSDPGLLSHLSQCVCRHQIPGYYHISHNVYTDIRDIRISLVIIPELLSHLSQCDFVPHSVQYRCTRLRCPRARLSACMLIFHKGHNNTIQVYSVTVMTHAKHCRPDILARGHLSLLGPPITPVHLRVYRYWKLWEKITFLVKSTWKFFYY